MFTKTILLRRKRRLRFIGIILLIGAALALAPLLIGLVMMAIEEAVTGKNVGEHNSIWGVLPWLTMGTIVIFGGPTLIAFKLTLLVLLYDTVVIALEAKKSFDEDEENGYQGKAWDEGDDEGDDVGEGWNEGDDKGDDEGGGWSRNEHDPKP